MKISSAVVSRLIPTKCTCKESPHLRLSLPRNIFYLIGYCRHFMKPCLNSSSKEKQCVVIFQQEYYTVSAYVMNAELNV
jgi:hypothetical protein